VAEREALRAPYNYLRAVLDPLSHLNAVLSGRYRVERELGEGGMATVYLADDLRHDRKVALKVLRPELAAVLGAERFLAEIKTTARLQHPHILPLFDSGEADGILYYVMPHVEGESLRERLERHHQLPVEEAVRIGASVADALDYAHRRGVIHRDIKPANILLHDGRPVVADFGIALAVSEAGGERLTQTGLSLGTPYYMSPEQATGDWEVDGRSDVYSLGAVVYEMLRGEPPHMGTTAQAVLARVLTERAQSVRAYRETVPEHVDAALQRALARLPADRFATAAEFAEALTGARPVAAGVLSAPLPRGDEDSPLRWRQGLAWAGAGALVTAAAVAVAVLAMLGRRAGSQPVMRFATGLQVGTANLYDVDVAISADGTRIAYVGGREQPQLFMRRLDEPSATAIAGLTPRAPFFSVDGTWIGFFDSSYQIKKLSVSGGPAMPVARTGGAVPRGASWGPDDYIIFSTADATTGLLRVPAAGGEPEVLTLPDKSLGELDHVQPDVLPDGRAVLFTILGPAETAQVAVLDLTTGRRNVLINGASHPRYASSGHLIYLSDGALYAVGFDSESLEVRGGPVRVLAGVAWKPTLLAEYALSQTGSMVYLAGGPVGSKSRLVWVDREGREEDLGAPARAYAYPQISPDGTRVAVDARDQEQDIWIWDLTRLTLTRVTSDPAQDINPEWTPDGASIVFSSTRDGAYNIYRQPADGTGTAERLHESAENELVQSMSPEGETVVFRRVNSDLGMSNDLLALSLDEEHVESPLIVTQFSEQNGEISPDGRWIAYQSNESGRDEIYLRPYPDVDARRIQASTEGGNRPAWARSGMELFFLGADERLMVVPVALDAHAPLSGTVPARVLERRYVNGAPGRTYDVSPDGQRFLMVSAGGSGEGAGAAGELVFIVNWFEELKRLVPN